MFCVYIGDAGNVISRILTNHCRGNVEGSKLRQAVALKMGFTITRTKRASGIYKIRIDLPNPKKGEVQVSEYIRSGGWKYMIVSSSDEAEDFQWFLIDRLDPLLNKARKPWKRENAERYVSLFNLLELSPILNYSQLKARQSGPGAYVFYHD